MKKTLLLLLVVIAVSCKNEAKKEAKKEPVVAVKKEVFPTELGKVFEAHGGIDKWTASGLPLEKNVKQREAGTFSGQAKMRCGWMLSLFK